MIMRKRLIVTLLTLTLIVVWAAYPDDVAHLRAGGQQAVDQLHAQWSAAPPEARAKLAKTLDRVCAQKDCSASRLYWYTDLDEAKIAAKRLGRPILSLHMLGRLDEELSCANSRFFRTLLYSDPAIAAILRDKYVLHWHSVRDVPVITIDMGDGRRIRQTITGNSVHYLLAADGTVLDVLPGLYSPGAFLAQLEEWQVLQRTFAAADGPEALRAYHRVRTVSLIADSPWVVVPAALRAETKMIMEVPMLNQLTLDAKVPPVAETIARSPWRRIGEETKDTVHFSEGSLALMRLKQPLTEELLDNLRRTVATDTAYNEGELHRRAHEWFADGEVRDLASLNERVYAELFLTPSSDPWLGLQPRSVFAALAE
jgi:hypothetical protein